jgi:hypothetical protein
MNTESLSPNRGRLWTANLLIAAMGLVIFAGLNARSGRVEANEGLGWDGRQYAHMVTDRLVDGTANTQARPLLPLLTRIPYGRGLGVIRAFEVMNFLYATVLYVFLCLTLDLYGTSTLYKAYFVGTVALSIATSKMFAFYPVQIDLGALAVLTSSTYLVLTRRGWVAGAAALVAATTREFNAALSILGLHRGLRQGDGVARAVLTYAPTVCALVLIRRWAAETNNGDADRPILSAGELLATLAYWRAPALAMFFLYFLLTLLGGITVLMVLRPASLVRSFKAAPELATFSILILAAAATRWDVWRHLVFLLPVLTILFAGYVNQYRPGPLLLSGAFVLTLVTQQPFRQMDMTQYFRDWFPLVVYFANDATPEFWSTWKLRLAITGAGVVALAIVQWKTRGRAVVTAR